MAALSQRNITLVEGGRTRGQIISKLLIRPLVISRDICHLRISVKLVLSERALATDIVFIFEVLLKLETIAKGGLSYKGVHFTLKLLKVVVDG